MDDKKTILLEEYKLGIETQMHFNELLMKLRSVGLTAVIVIAGYSLSQSHKTALLIASIVLLISLFILDIGYFFPLLLGAVDRTHAIENELSVNITGSIIKSVGRFRAWIVLISFYLVTLIMLILLTVICTNEHASNKNIMKEGSAKAISKSLLLSLPAGDFHTLMMESTFKIYSKSPSNTSCGTCFILEKMDEGKKAYILVTADHVLSKIPEDNATLVTRQKTKNDSYVRVEQSIQIRTNGTPLWDTHPIMDIAGLLVTLPSNAIPKLTVDALIEDKGIKELGVGPGSDLFVLGYPFGLEANDYGFPILKKAMVASYPIQGLKSFLIDFPALGGYSGAPVYGINRDSGSAEIVGILIEDVRMAKIQKEVQKKSEVVNSSMGLGVVVSARMIREMVDEMVVPVEVGPGELNERQK